MNKALHTIDHVGVVILAAGKGSRLGCTDIPKVMLPIGGKPIVEYIVETLEALGIPHDHIMMVVGFCKDVVIDHFGTRVSYAVQEDRKGTAHAAYIGMKALPREVTQVLVLGGDDSAFYTPASLATFIAHHREHMSTLSLLSAHVTNNAQYGRIVRHADGSIEVIEKEYVTPEQALITEVSTGTFCFDRAWFEYMFPTMPLLRKLGEYGLPTALSLVRQEGKPYHVVPLEDSSEWFGINTPEELEEADRRKKAM